MLAGPGQPPVATPLPVADMAMDPDLPPQIRELRARIGRGLEQLDDVGDVDTRDAVYRLLEDIDTLHRDSLGHLMALIGEMGGPSLVEGLSRDPVTRSLLELYDLLPQDRGDHDDLTAQVNTALLEEAPDTVPTPSPKPHQGPEADIAGERRPLRRPRWVSVARLEEMRDGESRTVRAEGSTLLLVRLNGEVYAYADGCPPESMLTLHLGLIEGVEIICPWHGCRYDGRTGRRTDGDGRLAVFPVAVQGGEVRIALGTQEVQPG